MLDWQIKTLAKKSAISGREIKPGDCVVCAVFVDELGNLDRIDVHKDEFDASKINGKVIGWWERVVSDAPDADERAARKMALASSEDFSYRFLTNSQMSKWTNRMSSNKCWGFCWNASAFCALSGGRATAFKSISTQRPNGSLTCLKKISTKTLY